MFRNRRPSRLLAFSLVEVVIALAITSFSLASLFAMFSQGLNLVRAQQETMAAASLIQQRMEQIRGGTWATLTNAARLQSEVMGNGTPMGAGLTGGVEEIVVSPCRPALVTTPLRVRRQGNAAAQIVSQPAGTLLSTCLAVRVDVRVSWLSRGRTRVRESSTIVAEGGILR